MEAALFAVKTGFVNPIYAVDNKSYKFKLIDNQIQKTIGRVPRPYAEVAYAAFWVAALTENATLGTNDINYLKRTFLQITNSHIGITGDTGLNEAGDRKHGDYDFWAIRAHNGNNNDQSTFEWKQVGRLQFNATNKHADYVKNRFAMWVSKREFMYYMAMSRDILATS
jgi:ABC-type branched-subunit amino acid transport system substrate-binding protein